jgi:hypothetical protein
VERKWAPGSSVATGKLSCFFITLITGTVSAFAKAKTTNYLIIYSRREAPKGIFYSTAKKRGSPARQAIFGDFGTSNPIFLLFCYRENANYGLLII